MRTLFLFVIISVISSIADHYFLNPLSLFSLQCLFAHLRSIRSVCFFFSEKILLSESCHRQHLMIRSMLRVTIFWLIIHWIWLMSTLKALRKLMIHRMKFRWICCQPVIEKISFDWLVESLRHPWPCQCQQHFEQSILFMNVFWLSREAFLSSSCQQTVIRFQVNCDRVLECVQPREFHGSADSFRSEWFADGNPSSTVSSLVINDCFLSLDKHPFWNNVPSGRTSVEDAPQLEYDNNDIDLIADRGKCTFIVTYLLMKLNVCISVKKSKMMD